MQTFTDTYRNRFVLANLVGKEFKALYRSMALGAAWALLQPLVLTSVLSVVWIVFFGQDKSFPAFVLVALIPYNFLSYSVSNSATAIVSNRSLVKKVRFPRQILPFSVVVTQALHFAIQFPLVIVALFAFGPGFDAFGPQLLFLPVLLVVHIGLALGLALLVSALGVVFRDVKYIVDSLMSVMFWISPILYDAHGRLIAADSASWVGYLYYLNPYAGVLEAYRAILFYGQWPDPTIFAITVVVTLSIGCIGVRTFWVHERSFADLV